MLLPEGGQEGVERNGRALDGAAGLRFMGVLDAEHNYRPKIF